MTKEQECMKALQCLYLEVPSVIADDIKQKVIDALNEVKNCTIPHVSVSVCYNRDCFYYDKTDNTCVGNYKACTVKQTER